VRHAVVKGAALLAAQHQEAALRLRQGDRRIDDEAEEGLDLALRVDRAVDPLEDEQVVALARDDAHECVLTAPGEELGAHAVGVARDLAVKGADADPGLPDFDPVPLRHRGSLDLVAIDARAVRGVVVNDFESPVRALDPGVAAGDLRVAKADLVVEGAADRDDGVVELDDRADAVLDHRQSQSSRHASGG
jgi:hypothetical protein